MTEAEWLACNDADEMRIHLWYHAPASDRKLRLWACACCRLMWHNLVDRRSKEAIETAERFVEQLASEDELAAKCDEAEAVIPAGMRQVRLVDFERLEAAQRAELAAARAASSVCRFEDGWTLYDHLQDIIRWTLDAAKAQHFGPSADVTAVRLCDSARDIFGNPYRPVSFDPAWRTGNVVALAQTVYEERELPSGHLDRTRLAILADALMDAGCDSPDILDHCRGEGPHVRGCWVIDLILGKE